jgi:hypothetical protein
MPKIRRRNVPSALLNHLLDRIAERQISAKQLEQFADWLVTEPEVPEGRWFKRFPEMIVCGEDEWSRGDASDIDGIGREAEVTGSERVNW